MRTRSYGRSARFYEKTLRGARHLRIPARLIALSVDIRQMPSAPVTLSANDNENNSTLRWTGSRKFVLSNEFFLSDGNRLITITNWSNRLLTAVVIRSTLGRECFSTCHNTLSVRPKRAARSETSVFHVERVRCRNTTTTDDYGTYESVRWRSIIVFKITATRSHFVNRRRYYERHGRTG